jgi:predicted Rossmann-fold nucleotide-binding protein
VRHAPCSPTSPTAGSEGADLRVLRREPGNEARYVDAARDVGAGLAARGIGVVYGGGRVGLMGALADAALAAGGM